MDFLVVYKWYGRIGTIGGYTENETSRLLAEVAKLISNDKGPDWIYIFDVRYSGEYTLLMKWFRE